MRSERPWAQPSGIQGLSGDVPQVSKRRGHGVDQCNAEVKKRYVCTSIPPSAFFSCTRTAVVLTHSHINSFCNIHSYKLISFTKFNSQFLYSLTVCMLHYNPRHVSSINMPIFRRTNCIITASGIFTLCTVQYSMPDESRLHCSHPAYRIAVYRE